MDRTGNTRRTILLCALLGAVTLATYWPATRCDFVNYDDPDFLTANPHVQSGLNWEGVKWAFGNTEQAAYWAPLMWLSHTLAWQCFGPDAWGHHLVNVLLHAASTVLVFLVFRRMTGATWRSALLAALFGLHPLRVESVVWVTERKDVLSVFFFMLTLWAYVRYAEVQSPKSKVQSPRSGARIPHPAALRSSEFNVRCWMFNVRCWMFDVGCSMFDVRPSSPRFWYWAAVAMFALGLMSKPMLVTLPFVLLLLDYWPLQRFQPAPRKLKPSAGRFHPSSFILHPLLLEKLPFFALAVVASVVTFLVQTHAGALAGAESLPLGARSGNALVSYCRYLGKLVWPTHLAVIYPHHGDWPLAQVLLAGGLLLGISALLFAQRRRAPFLLMGWLWYCGTLVPVIGVVQSGVQAMADRFTYVPSLGVLAGAVWGACELTRRWRHQVMALSVAGAAAIVLCLALTRQQIGYWKDTETLFRHALDVTENNEVAQNDLGACLLAAGNVAAAEPHFAEALRIRPTYPDALMNLAQCHYRQGRVPEAIDCFQRALDIQPTPAGHFNLALALKGQGRLPEAEAHYRAALQLRPDFVEAWFNLGALKSDQGDAEAAAQAYGAALQLRPGYTRAHFSLGQVLVGQHKWDEAIAHLSAGLRAAPQNAEARFFLGAALASQGHYAEAAVQFAEACRLRPEYPEARASLGQALFYQGKLPEAVPELRQALEARPSAKNHYYLALALHAQGQLDEALPHYREAARLEPNTPSYLNDLAWILATHPKAEVRDGTQAVRLAEAACRLTGQREPLFIGTLAAAYAETGRFADAVNAAGKAMDLAAAAGLKEVADKNRQLIELYRAGKPVHETEEKP